MSQVEEKTTLPEAGTPDVNRRNFLRYLVGGAGLAALAATPAGKMLEGKSEVSVFAVARQAGDVPELDGTEDAITRMNADLACAPNRSSSAKAIYRPAQGVGASRLPSPAWPRTKLPPGVVYRPVLEEEWTYRTPPAAVPTVHAVRNRPGTGSPGGRNVHE